MKTLLLKLDNDIYNVWKMAAIGAGLNVSEWIRRAGNRAADKSFEESAAYREQSNGDEIDKDVPRAERDSVPRRRRTAGRHSDGGYSRSAQAGSGAIHNGAHGSNPVGGTTAAAGIGTVEPQLAKVLES